MHFTSVLAVFSTLSLPSFLPLAIAQTITAENHSFGGVNYPLLQYYTPQYRDEAIRAIVKSKARVIRLFIRPDEHHTDPEPELGEFDKSLLDQLDDTLAAIHHISEGQVKVIIAPHDAHALRGDNGVPCDAYCKKLGEAFLDFYSFDEYRELYKTRLEVFFKHYPSKNFGGRSWSQLSEVIMGVDIQNQPFSDIWPIPAGESWLCDIATHLKFKVGLDSANIAVISGGVSGLQSVDGIQNFPDSVFNCPAIDVIGIHGKFARDPSVATAGTPWAQMFVPGNTLTGRAMGKPGKRKLLLVEQWEYVHTDDGIEHKREDIFDQGTALNLRGIPWLYSHLSFKNESTSPIINPLRSDHASFPALSSLLTRASTARSHYNWTTFLPAPSTALTRLTSLPLNPYIPSSSACVFGCPGHLCLAADDCGPSLLCKNALCTAHPLSQPGAPGARCDSKKKCQPHLRCTGGTCSACVARPSLPTDSTPRTNSPAAAAAAAADLTSGSCAPDSHPLVLALSLPICLSSAQPSSSSLPCENPSHCPSTHSCTAYTCVPCPPFSPSCLGSACTSNRACGSGYCNEYARCDVPGKKKLLFGIGLQGKGREVRGGRVDGVPRGEGRGAARVRDEVVREVVMESVVATATGVGKGGVAGATGV